MKKLENLNKVTKGKYEKVLLFHGTGETEPDIIDCVMDVCRDIMEGRTDNIPLESLGYRGMIAKAMDFNKFARTDGGRGNIVYNPGKVFER